MRPEAELAPAQVLPEDEKALRGLVEVDADGGCTEERKLNGLEARRALLAPRVNYQHHQLLILREECIVLLGQL